MFGSSKWILKLPKWKCTSGFLAGPSKMLVYVSKDTKVCIMTQDIICFLLNKFICLGRRNMNNKCKRQKTCFEGGLNWQTTYCLRMTPCPVCLRLGKGFSSRMLSSQEISKAKRQGDWRNRHCHLSLHHSQLSSYRSRWREKRTGCEKVVNMTFEGPGLELNKGESQNS